MQSFALTISPSVTAGEKIQRVRLSIRPKITQGDLADQLGVTRSVVANFEAGRTEVPLQIVRRLAYDWRIPEGWFLDGKDTALPAINAEIIHSHEQSATSGSINLVPYWGEVPCGEWAMPTSDPDLIQISDAVDPRDIVVVKVVGNSMLPMFRHGMKVACRKVGSPIDGVVHLCHNQDGEFTLKVVRMVNGEWQLHSTNPEYPPVTADKWTILARAVHVEESDPAGLRP